ncbi:MAG: class II fructose-bisphosphate aldolase [Lachnospiraceae bacterium]
MALVTMKYLLEQAQKEDRGIGAFSVGNMEMIKGAIMAAEEMNTPIILQIAEVRLKHSPLSFMGPMMVQAAKEAKVDIAVHLDHGLTMEVVEQALELGFTSVMFDSSTYSFAENMMRTQEVVEKAKKYGATVEAELGLVGGSEDGSYDHGIRCTNPEDAKWFCEHTGIDALAVAIGNAHGNYPVAPILAFHVLEDIKKRTQVPLVLHGGSGITDDDFRKAISLGIVKVNIATASFNSLIKRAEEYFQTEGPYNYFSLNEAMVQGTYENVKHHIEVFQCSC